MVLTFKENMRIINDSIESVDQKQFAKLLSECTDTLRSGHRIIASGLGKNVPVCEKFAGSMVSMGMDACFLHTNSAVHGDMGIVKPGDLVILLTKSGSTEESVYLADLLQRREGVNLWLLTFNSNSVLTDKLGLDKCLVLDLEHEGDQWNVLPNNSTAVNLIVLQTLAMELSKTMGIRLSDFKPNHPGGAIGQRLKDSQQR